MSNNVVKKPNKNIYKIKKTATKFWKPALISFGAVFLVAILSSLLVNADAAWFVNLVKPIFYPPSWVFSVVWTIIYFLVAIGLFLVLLKPVSHRLIFLYVLNGLFNIIWNLVFFRFQSLFGGVLALAILIVFAYFLIKELYATNRASFYLTLPYFLWLFFAFILNYSIYFLN
jgi:tryptophan-rich sensory protein